MHSNPRGHSLVFNTFRGIHVSDCFFLPEERLQGRRKQRKARHAGELIPLGAGESRGTVPWLPTLREENQGCFCRFPRGSQWYEPQLPAVVTCSVMHFVLAFSPLWAHFLIPYQFLVITSPVKNFESNSASGSVASGESPCICFLLFP